MRDQTTTVMFFSASSLKQASFFVRGTAIKDEDSPVVERAKLSSERLPLLFDVGDEDFNESALQNLTVDETCFG